MQKSLETPGAGGGQVDGAIGCSLGAAGGVLEAVGGGTKALGVALTGRVGSSVAGAGARASGALRQLTGIASASIHSSFENLTLASSSEADVDCNDGQNAGVPGAHRRAADARPARHARPRSPAQ